MAPTDDDLRLAATKLRKRAATPFQGEKTIHPSRREACLWLASMPKHVAETLAALLHAIEDDQFYATVDNAQELARRINEATP